MSKVTISVVSFGAGLCTALSLGLLNGHQTSTLAQAVPPASAAPFQPIGIGGAIPEVPPLRHNIVENFPFGNGRDEVMQQLDGLECRNCSFNNVTLTYGGGEYDLRNISFVGKWELRLTGAARNTMQLVSFLQSMKNAPRIMPVPPAKDMPIIIEASTTEKITTDLVSGR